VKACPHHALAVVDEIPTAVGNSCELSGICVQVCHSGAREIVGKKMTSVEIMNEIEKDIVFYDESGGGVTFSGGEPFMQPRFLTRLLISSKERRIHTTVETCGFVDPEIVARTSTYVDQYLYDLKIIQDEKHRKFTRVSNALILQNLRYLARSHNHVIIRFPVIPSVNDDEENVSQLGEFVSSLRSIEEVDVLPYHELGIAKYKRLGVNYKMQETKPPSSEEVTRIAERLKEYGLRVKVGG
jgi:pyruvate formate lyase activating enzyme